MYLKYLEALTPKLSPKNKTTEVIFLFSYHIIFSFSSCSRRCFFPQKHQCPRGHFLSSCQLFSIPGTCELLLDIILQVYFSLHITAVLKDTLSVSLPGPFSAILPLQSSPEFVALRGCTEKQCIFLTSKRSPITSEVMRKLQNLRVKTTWRDIRIGIFNIILHM